MNIYQNFSKSWNPVGGACQYNCKYCLTTNLKNKLPRQKNKYSGEPRIYRKLFKQNFLNKGSYIVCNMIDLFADNVPDEIIKEVIDFANQFGNKYFFKTKNPRRFMDFQFPENTRLGVTIESNHQEILNKISRAPTITKRVRYFKKLSLKKFISIDPIIKFDINAMLKIIKDINPCYVIIGSNIRVHDVEPLWIEVEELIKKATKITKVILKKDLWRLKDREYKKNKGIKIR